MKSKISIVLLNLFFPIVLFAQNIQVQTIVDRNEMGVGDTLTMSISVSSSESVEVQEPTMPPLKGFQVANAWTSSSTSSRLVQGPSGMEFQTQRRKDFNFLLAATQAGVLTIPGFEVVVNGQRFETKPIQIQISQQGSGAAQTPPGLPSLDDLDEAEQLFNQLLQRRGNIQAPQFRNLPVNPNEAFFIQCEVDKTEVFEGEQIVVNWYIYTRGNIISLDRLKFPDLKGFWKEIIEEVPSLNFTQEVINGISYRKALLASHALFPIRPGTSVIDEYKIKAQVQMPSSVYGSFGFGKPYTYTKSSERIQIKVKPIPTEGKPADFSGAVGDFNVKATVDGQQFPVNQPFSLRVRFEGSGNAKLIELPALNLPPGIEIYDTKSESKYFRNGQSFKEFEVLIIPRQEGSLQIPAFSFSLFDPRTSRFVSKTTDAISIQITPNTNVNSENSGMSLSDGKKVSAKNLSILPDVLISMSDSSDGMSSGWLGNILPGVSQSSTQTSLLGWTIIYLMMFFGLALKAWNDIWRGQIRRDLKKELLQRLKKIEALIQSEQWRPASGQVTNAIYFVLGEVSGVGGASTEITKLLDSAPPSLKRELGAEILRISEEWQVLSFAPEEIVKSMNNQSSFKEKLKATEKLLLKIIDLSEDKDSSEP